LADRQALGDDRNIDFSEIPELTEEQFAKATKPNKKLIAMRIDPDVLKWLKSYGEGYSSLANRILRGVMEQKKRAGS
jgi:uncharacterized protein (DUF4415 family)